MRLAIALASYYFIHSLLASELIKRSIHQRFKQLNYRLMYSCISVLLLVPVGYIYLSAPPVMYADTGIIGRFVLLTAVILAYRLVTLSFRKIRFDEFVGLSSTQSRHLVTSGIYQHIRHPLYLAAIVVLIGLIAAIPSDRNVIAFIITAGYVAIGSHLEEKRLIRTYGERYIAYKVNTPMLLPRNLKVFFKYVVG